MVPPWNSFTQYIQYCVCRDAIVPPMKTLLIKHSMELMKLSKSAQQYIDGLACTQLYEAAPTTKCIQVKNHNHTINDISPGLFIYDTKTWILDILREREDLIQVFLRTRWVPEEWLQLASPETKKLYKLKWKL